MSKIMFENDSNFAIIAGTVRSLKDDAEKYAVRVAYTASKKDASGNWSNEEKTVDVYVRNQDVREDGTAGINYADRCRRMHLKEGSCVICYVKFTDSEHRNAKGYGFKYDGVLSIPNGFLVKETEEGKKRVKPSTDAERENLYNDGYETDRSYVVKGLVTNIRKKTNVKGEYYLSITVYTGKDKDGNFSSELIQIKNSERNKNAVANAEKVLTPRQDGTKIASAFLCGAPYTTLIENKDGELEQLTIYTAYDFSTTGQKKAS